MRSLIAIAAGILASVFCAEAGNLGRLVVSENGHYIQHEDGRPFFYMADTAWELFHRLDKEEAARYISDRASKGFNVIQAVALAELDGTDVPNAYGHLPLKGRNPSAPDIREGDYNDYWDHLDYIIDLCNEAGMYMAILPTWGRWWNDSQPIFNKSNAEAYGKWMAERYRDNDVIWILGGDRNPESPEKQEIIRAMAKGIRSVDDWSLMSFHPGGWQTSSKWFHNDTWLNFNGRQSGHNQRYTSCRMILDDFRREPAKPIIDIEPLYEDHPLEFRPDEEGHSNAWDVRRALYWSVFHGSAGITYGHHSVWQMYDKGRNPVNRPLMTWGEALDQPGAGDVIHLRKLMESRPFLTRVPAPEFIEDDEVKSSVPGAGRYRFAATMDSDGTYAMVYVPAGRKFSVRTGMLKASKLKAWWYSPRTGKASRIGTLENKGDVTEFTPPYIGEALDWVLILDDASMKYPVPGK